MSRFQYIRFQLEELRELSSISKIRKALLDLPTGLDATYDRILQNINAKFRRQVMNSLKWLAFSRRSLTIEELAELFIIDPDKDIAFDEGARLFSSSVILKYFSGLIFSEKETNTVRLVHFSIKEYLISDRIEQRLTSAFSFSEADAHIYISRSCLAYIAHLSTTAEKNTEKKVLHKTAHLKNYAVKFWAIHLEEVPRVQWPADVVLAVVLALADHSLSLSIILIDQETAIKRFFEHFFKKPHCYTAYSGFRQLTEVMIAQKLGANEYITQEDLDFGLHYAAYGGHLDIVQLFLEKGADRNSHCGEWASAVHAAVSGGHMNVPEFFVSNGADVNCQPPLFLCIPYQDKQLLKYLLDHGMNIDMQDEQHGTALREAIIEDDYASYKLLLERGADVNALNEKVGTPLQAACTRWGRFVGEKDSNDDSIDDLYEKSRRLHYIEKLLSCGADPNIRGGLFATPLQAACDTSGHSTMVLATKVVELLIKHGADVNAQGGYWGSALHAAAASAFSEEKIGIMKLLLDHGAKINQKGYNGETPLHIACREGTLEAVRFLVDRGANVNAEGGPFGTSILAAVASRDKSIIAFLMDKGANINYQGGEYGSALQAHFCYYSGGVELFRFLLKYCADVNVKGGKYGTALIAACSSSCSESAECVRLLLDHGADVNAQSGEYGTALIAACDRTGRDTTVVRWLLECGADVNVQGGKHGTALSAACSRNYYEAVKLLLKHGANLHFQDCAAWYSAIRGVAISNTFYGSYDRGDSAMLGLFLNRGVNINHEHAEYGTALHAMITAEKAGRSSWRKGVDFLLKHHINPNTISERLGSALHIACVIKHEDVHVHFYSFCRACENINYLSSNAAYLLKQCPNIDVNARGGMFGTTLQAAAYSGQILSVNLLLDRNASVNVRDGKYHSALNGAVISGHWNIVKILLAAGAVPDCHLQEQPDDDWLWTVLEEDGRGAVERYRKFWEVELEKKRGREGSSNS